jgi:hypothetical protein
MAVRLKADGLGGQKIDKWYVTDGLHAIGPVRLDLLAKGIELGRVPLDTFVRNESWKVWRPITDFTEGEAAAGSESVLRPFADDDDDLDEGRPTTTPEEPVSMDLAPDEPSNPSASRIPGTLPSDGVATLNSPPASAPAFAAEPSSEVLHESDLITLSHESKDLLGADRLTLASYIDDEETNIATTRPFGPPIVIDSPQLPPRPATKAPPPPSAVRVQRESAPPVASSSPAASAAHVPPASVSPPVSRAATVSQPRCRLDRCPSRPSTTPCARGRPRP